MHVHQIVVGEVTIITHDITYISFLQERTKEKPTPWETWAESFSEAIFQWVCSPKLIQMVKFRTICIATFPCCYSASYIAPWRAWVLASVCSRCHIFGIYQWKSSFSLKKIQESQGKPTNDLLPRDHVLSVTLVTIWTFPLHYNSSVLIAYECIVLWHPAWDSECLDYSLYQN